VRVNAPDADNPKAISGDALNLHEDEGVQGVFIAALERVGEELAALSDRALKARTAGAG